MEEVCMWWECVFEECSRKVERGLSSFFYWYFSFFLRKRLEVYFCIIGLEVNSDFFKEVDCERSGIWGERFIFD